MTTLPASGYLENAARTHQEMKDAFEDLRDFISERMGGSASSELTIAAGSITPTTGFHSVDTQTDAASDELDNILTTNLDEGSPLIIYAEDDARTVVLKHESGGAGQLHLIDDIDYSLDDVEKFIIFLRIGTDWYEVFRNYHSASTTEQGVVELATEAEALVGADTTRAVTSKGLVDAINALAVLAWDAEGKVWMYRNDAAPGMTLIAGLTDKVLSLKGGSNAYNVDGGNPDSVETWTWPSYTLQVDDMPSHDHELIASITTEAQVGFIMDNNRVDVGEGSRVDTEPTGGDGAHSHGGTTFRPSAAVGTLQGPDV